MLGRQERLAILLLLTVAAIVVAAHLVLEQVGKRPFTTEFSDLSRDGDLVIFSGIIESVSITKTGGHCVLKVDNLSIFIPGRIAAGQAFSPGTAITVIGTVQTYQGEKEVVIDSLSDIVFPDE